MKKVNLYLDETVWRLFRMECLQQGISASKAIERLIRETLPHSTTPSEESANGE